MAVQTPKKSDGSSDGTQAIRRAAAIMRRIGQSNSRGAGLAAITEAVGLPRSTTHRILRCLVDEGLVRHDQEQRRYVVGRLTYELGLAVTGEVLEIARWRAAVDRVAQRTGVTALLVGRSGLETTCLLKTEGNAAIRVIPVEVGQRRFLGFGAGSAALLAAMGAEESDAIIRTLAPVLKKYHSMEETVVRDIVDNARSTGFAISRNNVVNGVIGVGMAIPQPGGTPNLALSIAALVSQQDDRILEDWKQIIREEIEAVV